MSPPSSAGPDIRRLVVAALAVSAVGHAVALLGVGGGLWLAFAGESLALQASGVLAVVVAGGVTYAGVTTPDRLLDRLGVDTDVGGDRGPDRDRGRVRGDDDRAALRARLRRLAATAGVPEPDVRVVPTAAPNALTVGVGGGAVVCVTRGLVDALDDRELDAVLAHELAHVANGDAGAVTLARLPVRFLRALAGLLVVAFFSVGLVGGSAGVLPAFVGPVLLGVMVALPPTLLFAWGGRRVVARLARRGEFVADATAAELTGDPAALASALGRLDGAIGRRPARDLREANLGEFSLLPVDRDDGRYHPPTDERIRRLRERTREQATGR